VAFTAYSSIIQAKSTQVAFHTAPSSAGIAEALIIALRCVLKFYKCSHD